MAEPAPLTRTSATRISLERTNEVSWDDWRHFITSGHIHPRRESVYGRTTRGKVFLSGAAMSAAGLAGLAFGSPEMGILSLIGLGGGSVTAMAWFFLPSGESNIVGTRLENEQSRKHREQRMTHALALFRYEMSASLTGTSAEDQDRMLLECIEMAQRNARVVLPTGRMRVPLSGNSVVLALSGTDWNEVKLTKPTPAPQHQVAAEVAPVEPKPASKLEGGGAQVIAVLRTKVAEVNKIVDQSDPEWIVLVRERIPRVTAFAREADERIASGSPLAMQHGRTMIVELADQAMVLVRALDSLAASTLAARERQVTAHGSFVRERYSSESDAPHTGPDDAAGR